MQSYTMTVNMSSINNPPMVILQHIGGFMVILVLKPYLAVRKSFLIIGKSV